MRADGRVHRWGPQGHSAVNTSAVARVWVNRGASGGLGKAWASEPVRAGHWQLLRGFARARESVSNDTQGSLVEDRRFNFVRRHLRYVYVNPFSGTVDWTPLRLPDGGIRGLRVELPSDAEGSRVRDFVYVPMGR